MSVSLESDDYFVLFIKCPEVARGIASFGLEYAVEIGKVVESAFVAYLGYVLGGVHQGSGRVTEAYVQDVVRKGLACPEFEKTAEGRRGHAYKVRQVFEAYGLGIVVVDVFFHLGHPSAFGVLDRMGE